MKALFCEATLDISLFLSRKEAKKVKRNEYGTPVLEAKTKGCVFNLMNTKIAEYVGIKEPPNIDDPNYQVYWIRISDNAYADLVRDWRCGTRYGNTSKINIIIDEELSS